MIASHFLCAVVGRDRNWSSIAAGSALNDQNTLTDAVQATFARGCSVPRVIAWNSTPGSENICRPVSTPSREDIVVVRENERLFFLRSGIDQIRYTEELRHEILESAYPDGRDRTLFGKCFKFLPHEPAPWYHPLLPCIGDRAKTAALQSERRYRAEKTRSEFYSDLGQTQWGNLRLGICGRSSAGC